MLEQNPLGNEESDKQWRNVYVLGGIATSVAVLGILLDVMLGSILGGNLTALPQTAADRFSQFQSNRLLGLYNLDLLNIINQLILIPAFYALYAAHHRVKAAQAGLALIIFLVATTIFVTTNSALPMLELSDKYAAAAESRKALLAAAGEAMLARGAHGSPGVFIGFFLAPLAGVLMSWVMLAGKIFNRVISCVGIAGNSLMVVYVVLVTFAPATQSTATAIAMPGGLLSMAWMIMFTIRLFQLGRIKQA